MLLAADETGVQPCAMSSRARSASRAPGQPLDGRQAGTLIRSQHTGAPLASSPARRRRVWTDAQTQFPVWETWPSWATGSSRAAAGLAGLLVGLVQFVSSVWSAPKQKTRASGDGLLAMQFWRHTWGFRVGGPFTAHPPIRPPAPRVHEISSGVARSKFLGKGAPLRPSLAPSVTLSRPVKPLRCCFPEKVPLMAPRPGPAGPGWDGWLACVLSPGSRWLRDFVVRRGPLAGKLWA